MGRRIDLHNMICDKIAPEAKWLWDPLNFETDNIEEICKKEAEKHVYFQPPSGTKLEYPCITYKLTNMPPIYANNLPYHWDHVYQLTVIDRDPESVIREKIAELPTCKFERSFVSNNLNHYIFNVYY